MIDSANHKVVEFRKRNGFNVAEEACPIWMATLGPLELPLPNFRWRREILAHHDLNHLISGYDTSTRGELLVASWEVGKGCYSDWRARALCFALMVFGFIRYPNAIWSAFLRGRNCR